MKSKKVREFIDGHIAIDQRSFTAADIEYCAAMAEADRDAKAVEAHRKCCPYYAELEEQMYRCQLATECIRCKYMKSFIQKLNEE